MSASRVSVDLEKVEAVMTWERPKSVFEIRSFLGIAGYYRRFIEDFSKIVLDQKDMYKFMTLLPKDYCLIPINSTIKLVGPDQSVYTSYNTIAQKIII